MITVSNFSYLSALHELAFSILTGMLSPHLRKQSIKPHRVHFDSPLARLAGGADNYFVSDNVPP